MVMDPQVREDYVSRVVELEGEATRLKKTIAEGDSIAVQELRTCQRLANQAYEVLAANPPINVSVSQ